MNPIQRVIKRHRVRTGPTPSRPTEPGPRAGAPPIQKGARLVHVDGRLHAIEVTCSCGEVMLIEIDYEGAAEEVES